MTEDGKGKQLRIKRKHQWQVDMYEEDVEYAQDKDALPMISDNPLVFLFKFDAFQFGIKKNTSL